MKENKNVEVEAKAEKTKVKEQANVPVPQQEEPEVKPSLVQRGLAWGKRNGLKILKGAGLVLAGAAVGAFVGMTVNKRDDEDSNSDDNYGGDDYGWQPEPEDSETELDNDFEDFTESEEEEAS